MFEVFACVAGGAMKKTHREGRGEEVTRQCLSRRVCV